ncbi:hypothetical protein [Actinomyces mediterranea]|uniref:hypothetical protein n=1 Tax=Actinomyces mediterranea TaxID=1871028 RepID=UPI0009702306|nr:hypothetical protein [Actinomyces mediterranea]
MAQWKDMSAWGKVGRACDWLTIAVLVMSFGYALITKSQTPENTWMVAFLLFTVGRGLGDYDRNRRRIMDEQAAALQNGQ